MKEIGADGISTDHEKHQYVEHEREGTVEGGNTERSAGIILLRWRAGCMDDKMMEVLVIRRASAGYELPKGHVEGSETLCEAAKRELQEETGLLNDVIVGPQVGFDSYQVLSTRPPHKGTVVLKQVTYFVGVVKAEEDGSGSEERIAVNNFAGVWGNISEEVRYGQREPQTRSCDWVSTDQCRTLDFRSEFVKQMVLKVLESKF